MLFAPDSVASALSKSSPGPLPAISCAEGEIALTYASAGFAARCSADDAAIRALKGIKVASASQKDVPGGFVVTFAHS